MCLLIKNRNRLENVFFTLIRKRLKCLQRGPYQMNIFDINGVGLSNVPSNSNIALDAAGAIKHLKKIVHFKAYVANTSPFCCSQDGQEPAQQQI
jgi:hypothetical protein